MLASNGLPDLHMETSSVPNYGTSGFQNTKFLEKVTYNNFVKTNALLEWRYEDRRKAQEILPFLYLGPSSAARDEEFLKKEGITMVLAVRNTQSALARLLGSKVAEALGLEVNAIDVDGNMELIAAFDHGINSINTHLSKIYERGSQGPLPVIGGEQRVSGKVLVFCESGNERSASMVAAYIMAMFRKDLVQTLQIVQAKRFAVAFDDSLRFLLMTYSDILTAKRDVIQADIIPTAKDLLYNENRRPHTNGVYNHPKKRTLDQAEVDEMEIIDTATLLGGNKLYDGVAGKRMGVAPFQE